ncbi:hypothetical protein DFH07DRAFT_919284 [Mycena maculata]|uniref:F-box domain-containing protein n=1 Tax=Mycena maculata TaxID=230809 RepID=A0AAD7NFG1_9AGAR|nr:hypothetical protein DFH07DRAFT_919284 [Mycena maculata]
MLRSRSQQLEKCERESKKESLPPAGPEVSATNITSCLVLLNCSQLLQGTTEDDRPHNIHLLTHILMPPSAFSSKLGTNYCPRDDEVAEIRAILVGPSTRLKRLDDEIAELNRAIDNLTDERDSVRAYVDAHRALISPVRRLPLDVIQEIFMACTPAHRDCVMSAFEAPVLLGRICSSWRMISLSTPRLWSRLHIAIPARPSQLADDGHRIVNLPGYEEKLTQRLETTKTWLGRSRQCPLSLSVNSENASDAPPGSSALPIAQTLLAFTSRWQHISLHGPTEFLQILSTIAEKDVPMLETLKVKAVRQRRTSALQQTQWGSFGILRGQRLSNVTFNGLSSNPLSFPLRWEHLTSFAIANPHPIVARDMLTSAKVMQMLSGCARIRECQLAADGGSENSTLILPSLHLLHITAAGIVDLTIRHLLNRLSLPELRHFEFFGRAEGNVVDFAPFLAMSTSLETIEIETQTFTKSSLMGLFHALPPTMKHLRIVNSHRRSEWVKALDDEAFSALIPSTNSLAVSCPALQELRIPHCSISDKALLRFITARMAAQPVTLKRVEIGFNREMEVDIRTDIQRFVEDGLKVSITYRPGLIGPKIWQSSPWQGLPDAPSPPLSSVLQVSVDHWNH